MDAIEVGIREFQTDLAEYIESRTPVAITLLGKTVGFFIPVKEQSETDVAALKSAGEAFDKMMGPKGIDIEEAVAEFEVLRKKANPRKKPGAKVA